MRSDPAAIRRRRQQLRVLGILLIIGALYLHIHGSPWTPIPLIIGCFILAYALRKTR